MSTPSLAELIAKGIAKWHPWPSRTVGNVRVPSGQVEIDGQRFATTVQDGQPVWTDSMRQFWGRK